MSFSDGAPHLLDPDDRRRPRRPDPGAPDLDRDRHHRHPLRQRRPTSAVEITDQMLRQPRAPMIARRRDRRDGARARACRSIPFFIVGADLLPARPRDGHPRCRGGRGAGRQGQPAGSRRPPGDAVVGALAIDPLELSIGFGLVPLVDAQVGRLAARPRRRRPPPDRGRARHRDRTGAHPRRRRARLARVRGQGARRRGRPRPRHPRPPPGDEPGRRDARACRHPDDRARLRAAGRLDRRGPPRRGRGARLHGRRRRVGDRHASDRDDPPPRRRAAHAPGDEEAARRAQGAERGRGRGGRPRQARRRRGAARRCSTCCARASRSATSARSSRRSATAPRSTRDPAILAEDARQALARTITLGYLDATKALQAISLDPTLEQEVAESLTQTPDGELLAIDPSRAQTVVRLLRARSSRRRAWACARCSSARAASAGTCGG